MKVGIVARGLTKGGAARMVKNIISELDRQNPSEIYVVFTDDKVFSESIKNLKTVYIASTNKLFWDQVLLFNAIRKQHLDLMLYTKNIIPFTHIFLKCKKINIVTDLAYFEKDLNEYKFFDTLYTKLFLKFSCNIADRVLAISEFTKNDLNNRLGINKAKIAVFHLATDDKFRVITDIKKISTVLRRYSIKKPYIFYNGSLSPRKNILRALMAFEIIKDQITHNIYLAGGQSWNDSEVKAYIKSKLADRVKLIGYVEDDDLPVLFSAADLYLYPSIYEGFGLPILEAQACGCPVLTSHLTSCKEVAASSAIIVNPLDCSSIANGILQCCDNDNYRDSIILKGFENLKRFNWQQSMELIRKELNNFDAKL